MVKRVSRTAAPNLESTDRTVVKDGVVIRVRPPFASDEKRRYAKILFEHGFGYGSVAAMLELPEGTVRDWGRQFKAGKFQPELSKKKYRYAKETKRKAVELRRSGLSWAEVAEQTGASIFACRRWVIDAGKDAGDDGPDASTPDGDSGCPPRCEASV